MWKGSEIYLYEKKMDKSRHAGGFGGKSSDERLQAGCGEVSRLRQIPPELRPPPTCFLLLSRSVPTYCRNAPLGELRGDNVDCLVKYALTGRHINSSALGPETGDDLQATCSPTQIYCALHCTPPGTKAGQLKQQHRANIRPLWLPEFYCAGR